MVDDNARREATLAFQSPDCHYARATILLLLKREPEARAAAQRALELEPNHAAAKQFLEYLDELHKDGDE